MNRLLLVTWLVGSPAAFAQTVAPEVEAVLAEARAEGLPAELLEAKALEGRAKGVPTDRVVAVLDQSLGAWRDASAVLGDLATGPQRADLVPPAAAALGQGAAPATVRSLAAGSEGASSLRALSDVLYAGLTPAQADQVVTAALDASDVPATLAELPQATRLLLATRSSSATVTDLTAALSSGVTPLAAVPSDQGGPPPHSNAGGNDKSKGKGKNP